jgi:hypothetical protein
MVALHKAKHRGYQVIDRNNTAKVDLSVLYKLKGQINKKAR